MQYSSEMIRMVMITANTTRQDWQKHRTAGDWRPRLWNTIAQGFFVKIRTVWDVNTRQKIRYGYVTIFSLQWRHNERDSISNHRCLDCVLNPLWIYTQEVENTNFIWRNLTIACSIQYSKRSSRGKSCWKASNCNAKTRPTLNAVKPYGALDP